MQIDWAELARKLGAIGHCSTSLGNDAIIELLGEKSLCDSVDYYVSRCGSDGAELARKVLGNLQPPCAMERCYEIFQTDPDMENKRNAIELLRVVADKSVLPRVSEFLGHADPGIQSWGAGVIDQLLWTNMIGPADCEEILEEMRTHPNENVTNTYAFIMEYLNEQDEG